MALSELTAAARDLEEHEIQFQVRAFFVEKNKAAYSRLCDEIVPQFRNAEITARCGEFEQFIHEVVKFASAGTNPFSFVFIDPTGWTGYGMKQIAPVLRVQPGEVMVNFMTSDIKRFVNAPDDTLRATFVDLFGDATHAHEWQALSGIDREDAIVRAYAKRLKATGQFLHVASTPIVFPEKDGTYYHLVYATRSLIGLDVFRETERRAIREQSRVKGTLEKKKRMDATKQLEFLPPEEMMKSTHIEELIDRHRGQAQAEMAAELRKRKVVPYDELVALILERHPMTSQSEIKAWLKSLPVTIRGLARNKRAPKLQAKHVVAWEEPKSAR